MKALSLGILIGLANLTFSQEPDCKQFKDGKFKIENKETGNVSIIERKGKKQFEQGSVSQMKLEFKVKWIDACTYTLELKKILENPRNIQLPEDMILTVEIIETRENSYIARSTSNLYDLVLEDEIFRIE